MPTASTGWSTAWSGSSKSSGESEIPSSQIGEMVMNALFNLDQVAYVRYASVYKDFREASDFNEFVGSLKPEIT